MLLTFMQFPLSAHALHATCGTDIVSGFLRQLHMQAPGSGNLHGLCVFSVDVSVAGGFDLLVS